MSDPVSKTIEAVYSLARAQKQKRHAPIMPANALRIAGALVAIGFSAPTHFTHFNLRRRRRGTEVWVNNNGGVYGFNLSALLGVWPTNFVAARQWAAAWGAANGHDLREVKA